MKSGSHGLLLMLGLALVSCRGEAPADPARVRIVGGPGTIDGLFVTPRGLAVDPRGFLYAVDRTGRIQKFTTEGAFVRGWRTPASDNGRPTSLAVDKQGDVWVADTHYHRILRYSPDGELKLQFGREGRGPGEFLYPVGLQVAEDGTVFVSEFGGNDRVQAFDSAGRFLRTWGSFGEGDDQFRRPQSLALGRGGALYVADSANHRIVVYDRSGRRLNSFGSYGDGPGRLKYPYGVTTGPDGSLFVAEYGNHRVQRFTADGISTGSAGSAGVEPGRLNTPWAVAVDSGRLFVADAGNHRIQIWPADLSERREETR